MRTYSARKTYFSTKKGMHINNMTSKRYHDSMRDQDSLARHSDKKLVHVKGVLNKVVGKEHKSISQLATNTITETCIEENNKDVYNCNLNDILKSIIDHKPSAAVFNRYNKDIKKKLASNRRTVNPPMKIIASSEVC